MCVRMDFNILFIFVGVYNAFVYFTNTFLPPCT